MTKQELSQLYYLNREIDRQEEELARLEDEARRITPNLTGMPRGGGVSDRVGNAAEQIADLKALINLNVQKRWYERNRLMRYITNVEDSQMRQILECRYVKNMSWIQVAHEIGGGNTADGVRMIHNRFLKYGE